MLEASPRFLERVIVHAACDPELNIRNAKSVYPYQPATSTVARRAISAKMPQTASRGVPSRRECLHIVNSRLHNHLSGDRSLRAARRAPGRSKSLGNRQMNRVTGSAGVLFLQ